MKNSKTNDVINFVKVFPETKDEVKKTSEQKPVTAITSNKGNLWFMFYSCSIHVLTC